jgi:radical SAM/Cys-rich protein
MLDTRPRLFPSDFPPLRRRRPDTLQVNLGYRCNQQCLHCHVAAGPNRTEEMDASTVDLVLESLSTLPFRTLDLTGGAPELNPRFRDLVTGARDLGLQVIDRCNLTILLEPGQERLAEFLAENQVTIVASLPCYLEENVDKQRGRTVFGRSMEALRLINGLGYGEPGSGLALDLVYNPQGPSLPPPQAALEGDYKRVLAEEHGIRFNRLLALTNLPIRRFGSMLLSRGEFDPYMDLLRGAHSDDNLEAVMCRSLISVDWQGFLYDCDFNQMLDLPLHDPDGSRPHLRDLRRLALEDKPIVTADHCYGCTAGQGSSCGGALSEPDNGN